MAENLGTDCAKVCRFLGERVNKTGTKLLIYHGRVFMVDMKKFTLTKHDDELYAIIKPVKLYSSEHKILAVWGIDCLSRFLPVFEAKYPNESKVLYTAVGTLQKWINGEIKMWMPENILTPFCPWPGDRKTIKLIPKSSGSFSLFSHLSCSHPFRGRRNVYCLIFKT